MKNLNSAYILNLNEKKICVSSAVQEEMVRLRQKCGTKLSISNVEQLGISRSISICFQNCRSLQKHIEDKRKDRYITKADILGLCEMAVYSKRNVASLSGHCIAGVELILMQVQHIDIIFIYFPPESATLKVCKELFQEIVIKSVFERLHSYYGRFQSKCFRRSSNFTTYF